MPVLSLIHISYHSPSVWRRLGESAKTGNTAWHRRDDNAESFRDVYKRQDITITPLAIPMLCGPGAISSGITLMEDASEYTLSLIHI